MNLNASAVRRRPSGPNRPWGSWGGGLARQKLLLSIMVRVHLRFYLDSVTGKPQIWNHGVDEEEVKQVLTYPREDRPGQEGSRVANWLKVNRALRAFST